MYDIVALGELLIDFTPNGQNEMGMSLFARNPGGAPGNVLVMATRLGCSTAFIGKVGEDDFGFFLRGVLEKNGINTTGLIMTSETNTTLAFVQLNERGERSFSFYRRPGADMMLTTDEVKKDIIDRANIFHFGSVSLTGDPCRSATLSAVQAAKCQGKLISFDPNYRPPLWEYDSKRAKAEILAVLPLVDVLKVSEEEMFLLTDENDVEHGAELLAQRGPFVVLVSRGSHGAYCWTKNITETLPTYDVKAVDTTGAGDAFLGAVLFRLRSYTIRGLNSIRADEWHDIMDFANAAGSLTTTKKGAIPAMPTLQEIENCRRTMPLLKA